MVEAPPRPDGWDLVAVCTAVGLLAVTYLVGVDPLVQYAVWLVVFTIWMAWFVYYGTKWLYGLGPEGGAAE